MVSKQRVDEVNGVTLTIVVDYAYAGRVSVSLA